MMGGHSGLAHRGEAGSSLSIFSWRRFLLFLCCADRVVFSEWFLRCGSPRCGGGAERETCEGGAKPFSRVGGHDAILGWYRHCPTLFVDPVVVREGTASQ